MHTVVLYISFEEHNYIAEWSSSVARRAHNPKVVGSNPSSATKSVTVVDTISTTVIFYFPVLLGAYRIKMGVFRTFPAEN